MKKKERTFFENFKRFLKPIFDEKKMSMKAIIPPLLFSIIGILTVYLLKEITNGLSNGWDSNIRNMLLLFIFLMFFYYIIIILGRNWTHVTIWPMFRKYFYKKYLEEYLYIDNNEYEKVGTGKLIAMLDKGIHSWVALIVMVFVDIIPSFIFIMLSFILILSINFYYFLYVFIIFVFIVILTFYLQKKAKTLREKRRDSNIGITKKFVKILMSKYEILQNNKLGEETKFISDSLYFNVEMNSKIRVFNLFIDILIRILIDGSKILLILMFGIGFFNKTINFGEFVSLMSIIYILEQIFSKSIDNYIDFTKIIVDVEKLWDFFDSTAKIKGYKTGKKFKYEKGNISIENLSYGYSEEKKVFKDFDLDIKGGKVTAFVGNSGSGKSTLVKLIAGYIRSNKGNIIIDGQKINKVSLKSYYKEIGYLTQDPSVFDGTISDNLTYSIKRKLKKSELGNILKLSKCEFIYDLPNGIETEIGERGVRLSGGQKQRLAIAKIFLKDPKIIILDEPTSALDSFSEEQITKAMHNLFQDRTVIVIAHRLQTVKHADKIIVLEDGKIVETGNHKDLVKQKGIYKKMLDLQSGF